MLLTMEDILKLCAAEYIYAKHYKDNIPSHKAFLKAGYKKRIYTKQYPLNNGDSFRLNPNTLLTSSFKI